MSNVAISIKNTSSSQALVQLYHNSASGSNNHAGGWLLNAGAQVQAFTVQTDSLYGNMWWVKFTVFGGGGVYTSQGAGYQNGFQLGQLTTETAVTFTVNTSKFVMPLAGGTVTVNMKNIGSPQHITNVFVLMLENHSFDNIFAMSGISGITRATTSNKNTYSGTNYNVAKPAPYSLTTDPGHEFLDVVQQLSGSSAWTNGQNYPAINLSGFVTNYATSSSENTGIPATGARGDVMKCYDTPNQLPVINALATEYAICDHWYSSMPGPTWPNRYFVHCASSANMDDSPSGFDTGFMESIDGLSFDNGTIYDKLDDANLTYRLYNDDSNSFADTDAGSSTIYGSYAQVSSLEGITTGDVIDVKQFPADLAMPYNYAYTFIEPNYGDVDADTFSNGSSQHPEDGTGGGEALIKFVYETLRSSPIWYTSLLVIIYDEHGGYYDSVPPPSATPPGDTYFFNWYNSHGFKFNRYGVRVPAVVVSPLIPKGTVSTTVYDHSSIPRTLRDYFSGVSHLTNRDQAANSLKSIVTLSFGSSNTVRQNCLTTLPDVVRTATPAPLPEESQRAAVRSRPLPKQGNIWGWIHIMAKTEFELRGKTEEARVEINAHVKTLRTYGDVQDYNQRVQAMRKAWRAKNRD